MKRLFILAISLLMLSGCGRAAQTPEEPAVNAKTAVTTTEVPITAPNEETDPAQPKNPDAKPFAKDDITAIEANFKTIGDYVKIVPGAWYRIDNWVAMGGETTIQFFDHRPTEESVPFLYLLSRDVIPGYTYEWNFDTLVQKLPKILLAAQKVEIHGIDFAKIGGSITPPRGIKIGDPAQKLFDAYPDYRTGDSKVLYDITAIHSGAKPAWGVWDGEGISNIDFMGGGIMEDGVGFAYAEQPWGWEEREDDYTWLNMYNPRYLLTYRLEDNIVSGIEFKLLYHPG